MTHPEATPTASGLHPDTWAVTAGRPPHEPDQPLNVPITLAATYTAGGATEYGRYGNPTWTAFETTLGGLEGGQALSFSSGLAAVSAVLDLVPDGGRVVVPRHAYLGTLGQLREAEARGRLTVTVVDVDDTAAVLAAVPGAALVWIESPTNPALELADVRAIAEAATDAITVVDNTFATPLLQQPLALGADIALHSATKFIAGHSDALMGAVVTADDALHAKLLATRSLHGAVPGTLETFLALRGLRTLHLRLERSQASAVDLAERLAAHPAVARVRYPGFGGIVSVELAGAGEADAFVAAAQLWRHATSLGGVESTFERRRRWAGEAPTIPEGLVRLSVGIEHVDDLWADLAQALDASATPAVPTQTPSEAGA